MREQLGVNRQVFYATLSGFDTHSAQNSDLPRLQTQISDAVVAFQAAMAELDTEEQVTTFTASDFGRTLSSNGDGTDHGWGNNHFVIGGAVNGGNIYGDIPEYDRNSVRYTKVASRMIPTTSVDQLAATLGCWFGLNETDIAEVFPNLNNFENRYIDNLFV